MTWKQIKRLVLERDKKCRKCGTTKLLTIDHVIPLSRGGTDAPGNLLTLCKSCNENKSSFIEWDFVRRLRIAMYVDELVIKSSNDLKAMITSSGGVLKGNIADLKSWTGDYVNSKTKPYEVKIEALEKKIEALESYLKIGYVTEIETFEGYKKKK